MFNLTALVLGKSVIYSVNYSTKYCYNVRYFTLENDTKITSNHIMKKVKTL